MDVIAVFVQPMTEERVRAHLVMSMIDATHSDAALRRFQQVIFGQDKPILENQLPRRLPLHPRGNTDPRRPVRHRLSPRVHRDQRHIRRHPGAKLRG